MTAHSDRLAALRRELAARGLDGFVVPLTDEHQSEYVGGYAQRLGWLTGFGGSAGTAAVLPARAAVFTDGRYTLQVREQVSADDYDYLDVPGTTVAEWLAEHAGPGARIGYDPWLHTRGWARDAAAALAGVGAELVAVERNPVDAVWTDRPAPSPATMTIQPDALAGRSSAEKRDEIADWLRAKRADAVVLSALDSIAWALNVRGADVDHTPVALSFAIVDADGTADLFVDPAKLTDEVRRHLGNAVRLHDRAAFERALSGHAGRRVVADPERAAAAIHDRLEAGGATVLPLRDPVVLAKALKNDQEIAGHRAASVRDGAALCRFLRWVEEEAPRGGETELSAAARLLEFREATGALVDTSFSTISATGAHGAIPHYHVTPESDAPIEPGQLYLIDSGGQYRDGTTDVTRVVPVGPDAATPERRDRFTRVLKGHIALAVATFPDGTLGGHIDAFARRPLWEAGLDYAHGTGHGIGSFLSVHEGPQRIAAPNYPGGAAMEPLRARMMLSNEPGYYKAGDYGIRIENLVLVVPREVPGGDRAMLGFETLTLAPIERALIERELLTTEERLWLDTYHARVLAEIGPELDGADRAWLGAKCAPL